MGFPHVGTLFWGALCQGFQGCSLGFGIGPTYLSKSPYMSVKVVSLRAVVPKSQVPKHWVVGPLGTSPEGACSYMVYTWAFKSVYGNPFEP